MSRVRSHNIFSSLAPRVPYTIADRSFKSLNTMQDGELEKFLSYLVRFEAREFRTDPKKPPEWWIEDLHYPKRFHHGAAPIPFSPGKVEKMKSAIRQFYSHHRATELIGFSEKLASISSVLAWRRVGNDFVVFRSDTNKPLAVVSSSNIDYDLDGNRVAGILTNTGLNLKFENGPSKRLRLYQGNNVDDSDDSDDGCIVDDSDDVDLASEKSLLLDPSSLGSALTEETFFLEEPREFEFLRPIPPVLNGLDLVRQGSPPLSPPCHPVWVKNKRIPCKSFNAVDVPYLVRMGVMPKWCLANDYMIDRKQKEIAPFVDGCVILESDDLEK